MDLKKFVSSIDYDVKLAKYDILGSIAHVKMLAKCSIISKNESIKIINGLTSILKDFEMKKIKFYDEDIHTAIENELKKRIGEVAGKMHTARSRNDQVVLDEKLYLKNEILIITGKIDGLIASIKNVAGKNSSVIMPGFTHLQNAQPVLFSHWFLAYAWMLKRDKERLLDCYNRTDVFPLGAAAFAGTEFHIDRNFAAKLLGFSKISENSVDTVSDRDFIIEFLSDCAIISMHISRIAEELIIWSSQQFGFVKISDEFTTGSSIMPQKKNPDFAELLKGKTGKIYGNLMSVLAMMKGLPLSYNRDMQEDKEPLFSSVETLKNMLEVSAKMTSSIKIDSKKMFSACENGFILATDIADFLVSKGLPFRTAHGIVKEVVNYCIKNEKLFNDLSIDEWKKFSEKFDNSIYTILNYKKAIEKRKSYGGTSLQSVKAQLKNL
ncbi:MAG: argininosuccinate lyase [Elusimicrobia bacterium RIFOXYD2_FULL_34_15]|nr:MAG: argininosuccinate lyase [Elusimicrobia bacterium RIFOXYD2_FULL_34_15]